MAPIVIIGSGMAGYTLAREWRKLDSASPLLIITADTGSAYSKPMLSNALTKNKTAASLISATADTMASQLKATILRQTWVSAIDPANHTISLGADEETVAYSKLVLALGADPVRPLISGESERMISINNLADYARFRDQLRPQQHVAILGGGLIGCEFANDLANLDYQVSIIDRNPLPLGQLLPDSLAARLCHKLCELGIQWYANNTVQHIRRQNTTSILTLEDNRQLEVDMILSAIGLKPRIALASAAGVDVNRGITVDAYLRTSVDDIYALGDCAEVTGQYLPFIMPIMHGARALAQTLAGNDTMVNYPAMPITLKTPVYPIAVLPPAAEVPGNWQVNEQDNGDIDARYYSDTGLLCGFALGGSLARQASALASSISLPTMIDQADESPYQNAHIRSASATDFKSP